ncbi:MAG: hypothetical protein AzoDbin1_04186 [Azoarcus sp.]|nr:hypothetical protein [Azoarcus sp.]
MGSDSIFAETADTLRRQHEHTTAMWKQHLTKELQFA